MYIKLNDKLVCASEIREAKTEEMWGQFYISILYKGVSGDSTVAYTTRDKRDEDYNHLCEFCMLLNERGAL